MASVRSSIGASALIRLAHLALLIVGQSQDAQRENFVDLGAVKKIASAFLRDFGIVIKNDGRRKQRIALPFFSDQDWPGPDVLAGRSQLGERFWRCEQRNELAILHAQNCVS